VTTADGAAAVTRTEGPADVRLGAETLGSLYLGAAPVRLLHRAGRLDGTEEAVRRLAAVADLAEPAYSLTGF
jgi:predicted acetyltransferase